MTVENLWYTCSNWALFTKVHTYSATTRLVSDYTYFEDVLHDCAESIVLSFIYNASTDTMNINIK